MHSTEQKILNKFKREPHREISTTELVREDSPEEYSRIIKELDDSSDRKKLMQAKQKKAMLHRKVLYHLGNLVKEGILKVSSVKGKNEKYFSLSINEGELVIEKKHRQIVISKPSISTGLIEEYESGGVLKKFDADNWVSKLNCILLEPRELGVNKFYDLVYSCFSEVNDCLGLNSYEQVIQANTPENMEESLKRMDLDTRDHDRIVSIIIDVKNINSTERMLSFTKSYLRIRPKNINMIFLADSKELKQQEKLFNKILAEFSKEEVKVNLQNKKAHLAPIMLGKAGPYTLSEEEWKEYEGYAKGKTIGLAMASISVGIDLHNFFMRGSAKDFAEMMQRTAKTLLKANAAQRKKSEEYFKRVGELNKPHMKKFFAYSKNFIRFWNYDLKGKGQENFLELLESSKQEMKEFCTAERTIYRACGMPMNFDIVFSSVFSSFSPLLSKREYSKITIRNFKEFHSDEMKEFIEGKEKLGNIFEGNDRCRFFRRGEFTPEDVLRELVFLMNSYDLPLITYDFKETKGEMKLTSFLGGR